MDRVSFLLYTRSLKSVEKLTDEQAGVLFKAILKYNKGIELPEMDQATDIAFSNIQDYMDENFETYQEKCSVNRKNGAKGGRPKGFTNNHSDNLDELEKPKKPNGFSENPKKHKAKAKAKADIDADIDYVVPDGTTIEDSPDGESLSAEPTVNAPDKVPYQEIVNLYNSICVSLPRVREVSDSRRKAIRSRYRKYGMDDIEKVFRATEASDFLSGRNGRWTSCGFDWIMKPANFLKILEGNYSSEGGEHDGTNGKFYTEKYFEELYADEVV